MFCFCRLLQRALLHSKNHRLPVPFRQLLISSSTRCFSLENREIHPPEKVVSQALSDIRICEKLFRSRGDKNLKRFLDKCFLKREHLSSYFVHLLRTACESFCPPELVTELLIAFRKFNDIHEKQPSVSQEEKLDILTAVSNSRYAHLMQLSCTLFRINEGTHNFKRFVDDLIKDNKLVEAVYCIGALNLQMEYDIESIALPVLSEGKVQPVISCVTNFPDLQQKIVQKLDSLLIVSNIDSKNPSSNNSKKMFKILSILLNVFKIPSEQCKNLHYIRGRAAINMLIKRKTEQSISEITFEEMVMSIAADNPDLQKHLIYKLVMKRDIDVALKIQSKLNIHHSDIPKMISELQDSQRTLSKDKIDDFDDISDEKSKNEVDSNNLTLELASSDIKFIDTKEKFLEAINDISQNYNMVGMDAEWKPHFGLSDDRLALIQLAVHDKVYIIDMLSLNDCLETETWDKFMDDIFSNSKLIKLGCGIMSDVNMIVQNNKGTKGRTLRFSHILDMAVFYHKLQSVYPGAFETEPDSSKNLFGLSKLCEILLGKPLNKEERLCNWEKRPLSESQLEYAALDAHCLLQMYNKLKQIASEKDMNFQHVAKVAIVLTTSMWKPKRKLKGVKSENTFLIQKPVPIQQFKVLLDSELVLLGKQLRHLGADVVFHNSSESPEAVIQVSQSEKRIFICSEALWNQVNSKMPAGFCYKAVKSDGCKISVSEIIQHFNVQINKKDILSPCAVCNSEEQIRLSAEEIHLLQEQLSSKDSFVHQNGERLNSLQKICSEVIKSGINIQFHKKADDLLSKKSHGYLCTKCGTVQ